MCYFIELFVEKKEKVDKKKFLINLIMNNLKKYRKFNFQKNEIEDCF